MKKFIVERKLPGAGNMTGRELMDIQRPLHAKSGNLPINTIAEIKQIIDPATAG